MGKKCFSVVKRRKRARANVVRASFDLGADAVVSPVCIPDINMATPRSGLPCT